MTWGDSLEFLQTLKAAGKDPQALRDQPQLNPQQRYYQEVFKEVTESRNYTQEGMPLPIPNSEIQSYFETFYINSLVERERLFKMIRAQDRTFVKVLSAQAQAKAAK